MSGTIVVGVDGSETASEAARVAADLAASLGRTLHVVMAYAKDQVETVVVGQDSWLSSNAGIAEQTALSMAQSLTGRPLRTTSRAVFGKPDDALIAEAERLDASLIVLGNRRMQGVGRLLGSVANSVAHRAPCDVYIVKTVT